MKMDLTDTGSVEKFVASVPNKDTNKLWDDLKTKLVSLRDKFVPKKTTSDSRRIPINKDLQNAIRKKHSAHRRWMATRDRNDSEQKRLEHSKSRNKVSKLMRQAKRHFEKDLAMKCKINPKAFWGHVRRKLKTRSGVAPLLQDIRDEKWMK